MTPAFVLEVFVAVSMPLGFSTSAISSLRAPDWRSWVPAVAMLCLVLQLYRLQAPQPHLVAIAVGAWAVVLVTAVARLRALSVLAIVVCGITSGWLLLADALAKAP
jgi:hypothetical protein